MADVVIDDAGNVTAGSGLPLSLYNSIETYQTATDPLPDPNNPDDDFDGTAAAWKAYITPLIAKIKRAWAKEANAHAATFSGGAGTVVDTFANRPGSAAVGTRFISTDGATEFVYDGTLWRPAIHGKLGHQPPAASSFTLVQANGLTNQATLVDQTGTLKFTWTGDGDAGSGEPIRFAYKAAPSPGGTGYRVVAHLIYVPPSNSGGSYTLLGGLGFRNASSGSVELMEATLITSSFRLLRRRYTANNNGQTPTFTFSAQAIGGSDMAHPRDLWLRIERTTAGDRAFDISHDGLNWKRWSGASSTGNAFITPDQVFIEAGIYSDSGDHLGGAIFDSYYEEAY